MRKPGDFLNEQAKSKQKISDTSQGKGKKIAPHQARR